MIIGQIATLALGLQAAEPRIIRKAAESYYMDAHETTNREYAEFVRATGHRTPASVESGSAVWNQWISSNPPVGYEEHPVVGISWRDADAYCRWRGKRLPTEAEWEFACLGGGRGPFPGGGSMSPRLANYAETGAEKTMPVGSFPPNGFGLFDMAGNVWEMCSDWFDQRRGLKAARGGSFDYEAKDLRCSRCGDSTLDSRYAHRGVRCARSIKE